MWRRVRGKETSVARGVRLVGVSGKTRERAAAQLATAARTGTGTGSPRPLLQMPRVGALHQDTRAVARRGFKRGARVRVCIRGGEGEGVTDERSCS